MSAVVFGGYGAFGSLVCRELARLGTRVTVAGRSRGRAAALARELGPAHQGAAADARNPLACRAAIRGHVVAICCAGPFSSLGSALLEACLDARCHYADISDDRPYAARVRGLGERFRRRGLAAVYGASSLPGLSGALAGLARSGAARIRRAALHAERDGQRMAALPCALAARALQDGSASGRGALTAYELLGGEALVAGVTAAGFRLVLE